VAVVGRKWTRRCCHRQPGEEERRHAAVACAGLSLPVRAARAVRRWRHAVVGYAQWRRAVEGCARRWRAIRTRHCVMWCHRPQARALRHSKSECWRRDTRHGAASAIMTG
jgi:hypothetical protein